MNAMRPLPTCIFSELVAASRSLITRALAARQKQCRCQSCAIRPLCSLLLGPVFLGPQRYSSTFGLAGEHSETTANCLTIDNFEMNCLDNWVECVFGKILQKFYKKFFKKNLTKGKICGRIRGAAPLALARAPPNCIHIVSLEGELYIHYEANKNEKSALPK